MDVNQESVNHLETGIDKHQLAANQVGIKGTFLPVLSIIRLEVKCDEN